MFCAVSMSPRRSLRDDSALLEQHDAFAQRRRQVQIVRGHDHRRAAFAVEPPEQRRDFELIPQIERSGRLVQQQQIGCLCERAGNHDALLLAAAQRRERPAFEGGRAGRRERLACDRQIRGALELERSRDADSGPSARCPGR